MSEIYLMASKPCGPCKGTGKHPLPESEQAGHVVTGRCPTCDGTGYELIRIPLSDLRIRSREASPGQPYISSPALRFMEIVPKCEEDDGDDLPEVAGGRTAVVEASARQAARDRSDDDLKVLFSAYVKETLEAWNQKKGAQELEEALIKVEMAGDEMVRRARKAKS